MIYDKKLRDIILKKNKIPREVYAKSIKINNLYYSPYIGKIFKCIDIYDIYGVRYYWIEYDKKNHIIPFNDYDMIYILYNKRNNDYLDNILDGKYYYGYEILWWFIKKKIDISSNEYKNFKVYLYNNKIKSNDKYMIEYKITNKGKYYDIKFIKYKN